MGLFGKRLRGRAAAAYGDHLAMLALTDVLTATGAHWRPDGTGVQPNGDCGGDLQHGDSYSVRFTRADLPGSLITVTFYAAEHDGNPFEFGVQRQVEWLVCEDPADPGGTEIRSDYSCNDVSELVFYSAADAEQDARERAEAALGEADAYAGWDGQPW